MPKKQIWYTVLAIMPVYGANNSLQQFGEPWTGFLACFVVACVLFGISIGIVYLVRRPRGKETREMDLGQLVKDARGLPDFELLRRVTTLIPQCEDHIAAMVEIGRRDRFRSFWRKDIVAWSALILSIISLVVSIQRTH